MFAREVLRIIAVFEGIKGIAALAALIGVLDLMHRDVRHLAMEMIGRFGMKPGDHYPSVLLHYADLLPGANVDALVLLALMYVFLRMLEAYGLWNDKSWGEWIGALSGGLYVPFEAAHLMHRPSTIVGLVLASNVFLVVFLSIQLWSRRKKNPASGIC